MRIEPELDPRLLLAFLRDRYGLDGERLEFVPIGLDSWSYVGHLHDGGRVFVKLFPPRPAGAPTPRGAELPLLVALADLGRVPVARPVADLHGRLVNTLDGRELYVLEYLGAGTLEDEMIWPEALYGRVADTLAAIHATTSAVKMLVPGTERYELPFLPSLETAVAALEAGATLRARDDPALSELRNLVVPRAPEVRSDMERLVELRDRARVRLADQVLCHTDMWGSNLLLSPGGTIHVLDWDGAQIGPPEADLFMFAGTSFFPADRFGWFLDRYESVFRRVTLDAEVFGFYFYRRA